MSTELAIPNEPFTVYYDDDWKSIADIFNTYKEKFQTAHDHAKHSLILAMNWRKSQTEPPPKIINFFLDDLSKSLKRYDLFPDLRDDIPAHIDEIIDKLDRLRIAYLSDIECQKEAIDATRRFIRACVILQDLHTHGVSTQTPENLLKKLKDDLEQIALDFDDDTPGFKDGTAINLAEAFCHGTYQIEDWLLQHVYNSICLHNQIVPTFNVHSISQKVDDVKTSILGVSSKLDESISAANAANAAATEAKSSADKANTTAKFTREDVQAGNTANKNSFAALMIEQQNLINETHDLNEVCAASAAEAPILDPNKKIKTNLSPEEATGILYKYLEENDGLQYMKCAKTIRRWLKVGKVPIINLPLPPSALANEQTFTFWCSKYKWKCDHCKNLKIKRASPSSYVKVHPKNGRLVVD